MSGLLTVTISCCFFVLIPCKFSCIPFPLFSLLSQFLAFFLSRFHANFPAFLFLYFHYCHNFSLFFTVTVPCKFPCIPFPLFSLLLQFLAVCFFTTVTISCCFLSRFHANFPAFLSFYFHYCHNFLFFFYCHGSMQISLHSLSSIFTTVTIYCCFFVTIPCKFPCIPCPLFSLLSQFSAVFLSRFHANFPAFLSLYFHYCHNIFAVFFFYCHDSMQISLHSLPFIFTTVTISRYFLLRFNANFPAFLSLYFHYCHNFLLFFTATIPCKFPCIPCPLFSLLSQFLVVFLLSRFHANFPAFLALYFHCCHNFLLFFCHDSMQISLHSLPSIFTAVTISCCFFVTIPCKFPCIPFPLFSLLSQCFCFFFYCHDSMQISLHSLPSFITTVTISCCFSLHVILSLYFLS